MRYYVVKYALTEGITEHELRLKPEGSYAFGAHSSIFKIGRDCFEKKEDAVKVAEELRLKKIKSLEKQLRKLRDLTFR